MDSTAQAKAIEAYVSDPKNIEAEPNYKRRMHKARLALETGEAVPMESPPEATAPKASAAPKKKKTKRKGKKKAAPK